MKLMVVTSLSVLLFIASLNKAKLIDAEDSEEIINAKENKNGNKPH